MLKTIRSCVLVGAAALIPMTVANAQGTFKPDDPQMAKVIDKLVALGAKPLATLSVEEARSQPTPGDAATAVLADLGKSTGPMPVGKVEDRKVPGAEGDIPIRIYWPEGDGPHPVLFYIHGGGWVIADLDTYDASARALANAAGAIVVSTHYRQAPGAPIPRRPRRRLGVLCLDRQECGRSGRGPETDRRRW